MSTLWREGGRMSDYLEGMRAARFVQAQVLDETGAYREGYGSAIKASGIIDINALALMQNVKGDRDEDPDGYDAGFAAARETIRQLGVKSASFRAGFASELRAVDVKAEFERSVSTRVEEKLAERKYIVHLVEWKVAKAKGLVDETTHPDPRIRDAANLKFIADFDERADFERRVENKMLDMRIANGEVMFEPMTPEESLVAKERFWRGAMKTASPPDPHRPAWRSYETKDGPV
jgi:hypothetical protein